MMKEFIERAMEGERKRIITLAVEKGIFTLEDYNKNYKGKYLDHYGVDSFMNYLSFLMCTELKDLKSSCFVTLCEKMLKDRKKIEEKFGLKIISPGEYT